MAGESGVPESLPETLQRPMDVDMPWMQPCPMRQLQHRYVDPAYRPDRPPAAANTLPHGTASSSESGGPLPPPTQSLREGLIDPARSPPPRQGSKTCCRFAAVAAVVACVAAVVVYLHVQDSGGPPRCPASIPSPTAGKCTLAPPTGSDADDFRSICHPGAVGHAGGAEEPLSRCGGVHYAEGVFRCACCGAPLFYATSKFEPAGDGWPAFHGETATTNGSSNVSSHLDNTCSPGGTEVVCKTCGTHLGDYFPAGVQSTYSYYCIDGVCLLPPGASDGQVCQPSQAAAPPSEAAAYKALRRMLRERGGVGVWLERQQAHRHEHGHDSSREDLT